MRHTLTYLIAAVVLTALALLLQGGAYVLLWPAVACALLAVAYARNDARWLGKRPDGRLAWWAWVALLPYLGFTYAVWKTKRKLSQEDLYNEVAPGLWVGRRVLGDELPEGVGLIVDTAAEFAEPSSALARAAYRSFPVLNYAAPDAEALRALVAELRDDPRGVYIHCAQGHGRSATVAAALVLARGLAATPAEAEAMVVRVRPKVHLEEGQKEVLVRLTVEYPAWRGVEP
jgi:protein-tyrosine phosphatase